MLPKQYELSYRHFKAEMYPDDGEPRACKLHDAFPLKGVGHNCLGCNFEENTSWILSHLDGIQDNNEVAEPMTFYLLKLYLFVERAYEIFEMIRLPESYRAKHFGVFFDVHKWANFIKHPKAFLLVHHPEYFVEGMRHYDPRSFGVTINQSFVIEYYSGTKKNGKLYATLKNKNDIAVLFPEPLVLTKRFCYAIHEFCDLIANNPVYAEVLSSDTTYEEWHDAMDEDESSESTHSE